MTYFKKYSSLFLIAIVAMSLSACSSKDTDTTDDTSSETEETSSETATPSVDEVLSEVKDKYIQLEYTDTETGITLPYNLFVPENYDETKSYPLVMFVHDDSVVGKGVDAALSQGYGGIIWATKAEQEKHPSFVLVPAFKESTISGGDTITEQADVLLKLLASLKEEYNVDDNRIYATGQSMGCMTELYLNATQTDLFAASMYVGGQWDASVLSPLAEQKFFYITAGGDEKASGGQADLKALLKELDSPYSEATWDATWTDAEFSKAVSDILAEKNDRNFATFETGTVLEGSEQKMEHMASFDHAYAITGVRDWLFEQTK